jgi:hypothetical protein
MFSLVNYAQLLAIKDSAYEKYKTEQETLNHSFSKYFFGNFKQIYSSNESKFVSIIDSLRQDYIELLARFEKENPDFDKSLLFTESKEIHYTFDKFLVEYPYFHERYTGEKIAINARLDSNLEDFNNPDFLNLDSYVEYLKAFLYYHSKIELEKGAYNKHDNQQLNATLNLIPEFFSNQIVIDYLKFYYLNHHIENFGIKNIDSLYKDFLGMCQVKLDTFRV